MTDSKSSTSSSTSNIDGSWENFALKLIKQAHAEVDEIRARQNLPPWDWSKVPKPNRNRISTFWSARDRMSASQQVRRARERAAKEAAGREARGSGKKESRARAATNGSD